MRWFLAALLVTAGAASAQAPGKELFEALDLNGDGYVSLSEAAGDAVVVQRFDRADRDRDGKLSPKEFAGLKNVKVRVAKSKKDERSAATGSSARKPYTSQEKKAAEGG
jgi:hypothetical protein